MWHIFIIDCCNHRICCHNTLTTSRISEQMLQLFTHAVDIHYTCSYACMYLLEGISHPSTPSLLCCCVAIATYILKYIHSYHFQFQQFQVPFVNKELARSSRLPIKTITKPIASFILPYVLASCRPCLQVLAVIERQCITLHTFPPDFLPL